MELSLEEKKVLKKYSIILENFGINQSTFSTYYSYGGFEYDDGGFRVYHELEDSVPKIDLLTNIAKRILEELDAEDTYIDHDSKWQEIRVSIVPSIKSITVKIYTTTTDTEYSEHVKTFERMTEHQIQGFEEMKLECNCSSDRIYFNGGGDSGYIESMTEKGNNINGNIEDLLYTMLGNVQSGWEIDEGSQGDFNMVYNQNIIVLNFGLNVDKNDDEVIETIPFGD